MAGESIGRGHVIELNW